MESKDIETKIWSCSDITALQNCLILCNEYLDKEEDSQEKRELLERIISEL